MIQWVPSHLNDKGKEEERVARLADGTTAEAHIAGNDKADELAKEGALMHTDITQVLAEADGRREITRLVQNMMVQIWQEHKEIDSRTSNEDAYDDDPWDTCVQTIPSQPLR